ncbi:nucleoside diphosphate kinase regulator [Hymenobacter sp. YC55]|uniref:nucleoside diphosphate kinase regulator n=1 Tax=Hymenobacter sp. YC55 TaxID=3034019 RepID=UPI0023F9C176|nr:nucleoside diphosphate kinase regulator [Hymenobacter sp. YC55]MDF7813782.1 nucleoside diphosphate kinase regulator [Hymenobacter sp. YC55]
MNTIWVTNADYARLHLLVLSHRLQFGNGAVEALNHELRRAERVSATDILPDVVTMNSRVRLRDLHSDAQLEITLVYPQYADVKAGKISILAPVATAVLGCRVGDQVTWPLPTGQATYWLEAILYQPEATGDFSN